jgi:hypothetical protein
MHVKTEYQAIVMFSRGGPKKKKHRALEKYKVENRGEPKPRTSEKQEVEVLSLFINFLRNILQTLSLSLSLSLYIYIYIYIYIYEIWL